MKSSTQITEAPKLQPPGAGLPFSQRLILRLWYGPIVSKRTPRAKCREDYERLTSKLIKLASGVPIEKRSTRVLVDPLPGLEDSSRYWSLNEVLEHLLIVSKNVEGGILALAAGKIPDGKADTAKVKPKGENRDLLSEYLAYAPDLMRRLDERLAQPGIDFDSKTEFEHPWFGKFTARQWYWLLSSHQGIHYAQAKRIVAAL